MGSEEGPCYVIKRWKRDFTHKPPHEQFNFLNEALSLHLPVTRPVGWGTDHSGRSILATDYGGQPVNSPSDQELAVFAFALAKIHKAPIQSIQLQAPKNNQVFLEELLENQFPGLDSQHDILRIMKYLRKNIPAEHFSLIHGDYNLGNLLLKDDRLAVIDWTTSRIGDYRYDLAWSGFLLWIYRNEHSRTVFLESYQRVREITMDSQEYAFFELLAAVRWILIRRQFPVGGTLEKAYEFVNARLLEAGCEKSRLLH